jgi:hypothetical protein
MAATFIEGREVLLFDCCKVIGFFPGCNRRQSFERNWNPHWKPLLLLFVVDCSRVPQESDLYPQFHNTLGAAKDTSISVCVLLNKVSEGVDLDAWSTFLRLNYLGGCHWYESCIANIVALNLPSGKGIQEALDFLMH